jgi:hypothetical protein
LSSEPPLNPFDRLIRSLERSTLARLLFYLALPAAMIALLLGLSWACGSLPPGTPSLPVMVTAVLWILTVGEIHYVLRVAGRSLIRFAPALQAAPERFESYHHALTTVPPALLVASVPGGVALMAMVLYSDPSFFGMLPTTCQNPPLLFVGWLNSSGFVLATLIALRLLSLIRRIHAAAPEVKLFERGPLFAFSALSSRMAVLVAVVTYVFILVYPTSIENAATTAYIFAVNLPALLVIFVYPLYGMHSRMVEEKQRLLQASGRRIRAALDTLHSEGGRTPPDVDPHRRLTALMEEEAYLRKIPTWPWEPGTLTAVLTAIFLPLMLVAAQQVVRQLMGG